MSALRFESDETQFALMRFYSNLRQGYVETTCGISTAWAVQNKRVIQVYFETL